jgi:hypothetical protein
MAGAPKVFGSKPKVKPFREPDPEDRDSFVMSENVGASVLVKVHGTEEIETKKYGTKPAARLDVTNLETGETARDVLIFSAAVVSQVRQYDGGDLFVAEVESYESSYGTTGYKFGEPSKETVKVAEAFLADA